MNPIPRERVEQHRKERMTLAIAGAGFGLSVPVASVDKDGKPSSERKPITLDMLGRNPEVWVAWLSDTMLRSGRGFRKPSQRRGPTDARRADKLLFGSKLMRRLALRVQVA